MCCGLNCVFLKFRCGVLLTPVSENMTLFGNKVVVDVISYGEVDDGPSSSTTVPYFLFIYFGCAGSSWLHGLFSSYDAWASRCCGFSCCGAWALGSAGFSNYSTWAQQLQFLGSRAQAQQLRFSGSRAQAQQLWCSATQLNSVAPQHVESSWIRNRTCVSCIGRQILYH